MNLIVFGKTIIKQYDHFLYKLNYENLCRMDTGRLKHYELTVDNLDSVWASKDLRTMMSNQPGFMRGLGFMDSNGDVVGHAFLMTRGGTEMLYKIRTTDAYIFAVRVFDRYRGMGYSHDIMTQIIEQDKRIRGSNEFILTVKKDNAPARKCYERLGFEIIGERSFHRIPKLNVNIPYYTL